MKNIPQKSKKGGFLLLAALAAGYCIYLVFAGLQQAAGHSRRTTPIGKPFVPGHQTAPAKNMIRWQDSMRRTTYK